MSLHPRFLLLLLVGIASLPLDAARAQNCAGPFAIGEIQRTYRDPARGNRAVGALIRYPATRAGSNAPPVTGCAFPAVVFGHGFTIGHTAYRFISDGLVPAGYVLAFPSTEGGLSPSHARFAADLAFVARALATDSLLGPALGSGRAIGGHSMGGGSAVLAASGNAGIHALFALAPAETNPSAAAAATGVNVPTQFVLGSRDCVTPRARHAQPIFDRLGTPSGLKFIEEIAGGSHCQFSNGAWTCSFGESSCGGSATISASAQHAQTIAILRGFLDGVFGR
ncbi:MAG: hypothetical protein KatS3mg125_0668 [Lysobacterales bacterium]|jgi:pimeloyl-ACP methyl ester carboxylesterase|nr:MAG: hypothetical protein KatS3mg125_0668 [Xanthomonadales bacterium]